MFFKALAFDFDGTLASDDRIGPGVREALERARQAGLRLILVTGRTFFELSRVCDCLELFEAVVAENGAVLYYPGSAMIRIRARLRPPVCWPSWIAAGSPIRSGASSSEPRGATKRQSARRWQRRA